MPVEVETRRKELIRYGDGDNVFWRVRVSYLTTRRHPFRKEFEDLTVIARDAVEASNRSVAVFSIKNVWVSSSDISTEILCAAKSLCQLAEPAF